MCGEPISLETEEEILAWKFWISGLLSLITGILGTLGNCMSLLILRQKEMRNIFNDLLSAMCLADLLVIIASFVTSTRSLQIQVPYILYAVTEGVLHIGVSASVFMTISITTERFAAVCSPHTYQSRLATRGQCKIILSYILPVVLFSIVLNLPRLLVMTPLGGMARDSSLLLKLGIYSQVLHPLATTCLLPLIILSVLNYKIIYVIRNRPGHSSQSSQDVLLSRVMLAVVFIFMLLHAPRICLALYEVTMIPSIQNCMLHECGYNPPAIQWKADVVIRYLVLVNSSINFIIYCMIGSRFRETLFKLIKFRKDMESPRTHYTVTPPSDNGFDLQPVPKSRRQASRKDETTLSSAGPHTENPKILETGNSLELGPTEKHPCVAIRTETVQIERYREAPKITQDAENENEPKQQNNIGKQNGEEKQNGVEIQKSQENQNGVEEEQVLQSRDLVLRDIQVVLLGGRAEYV
ncbi:FMRFamide receptor isoform X2 [Eurytemora carolleeae]|nr:FMRFamide receptor isoform X2 [Eurytemora carolleeae]|eukprot:XP_023335619.1 FMRFamide receptor-like isoform X2 [Eurytemora affinis]